jgi:glycosyltransferase involved in cell wall biosynthesis
MTNPLVSVVIPAYNCAATIGASIESARRQTVMDLEILVVDDGSTDETTDVVGGITDARLQLLVQPNAGAAAARNTGCRAARGRYLAFLDADDIWMDTKIEQQLRFLAERPEARATQSGVVFVDPDLRPLDVRLCSTPADELVEFLMFRNLPAAMCTLVIEREAFLDLGGFDESLEILEDWEFMMRAARHANLRSLPGPLAMYRVHPANRSRDLTLHVRPGYAVLGRMFADPSLPGHIRARRNEAYARFYLMLGGGSLRVRDWRGSLSWTTRAALTHPPALTYAAALPWRRLTRRLSRSTASGPTGAVK